MGYQHLEAEFAGLTAAADYSTKQYYAVDVSTTTVVLASVAGQKVAGFLQNDPASGAAANVQLFGIAKAIYGGTVAAGDDIIVDADGKAIAAGNNTGYVIGRALVAGSANEIGSVLITHRGERAAGTLVVPITLSSISGAGDVVTTIVPGFAGKVVRTEFVTGVPVTTAAKAATLNLEIGTTNVTGGDVSLTSAALTPLGARVAGSAITAANSFSATDTLSVEASSVTAFAEGTGFLLIHYVQA